MITQEDYDRLREALNLEVHTRNDYHRQLKIVSTQEREARAALSRWETAKRDRDAVLEELHLVANYPAGEAIAAAVTAPNGAENPEPSELPLAPHGKRK